MLTFILLSSSTKIDSGVKLVNLIVYIVLHRMLLTAHGPVCICVCYHAA